MRKADAICHAGRYQRTPDRLDTRAGTSPRKLLTKAGEVELKVPRLRSLPFETEIIKRYQTKQSSVEEALIEMYLAGVSVRREGITEALWGGESQSEYRQRPQPEDLRQDRRVADAADNRRASLRFCRWCVFEAQLGW